MRPVPDAQARSQIGQSQHDLPARLSYPRGSKPSSPMTTVERPGETISVAYRLAL